MEQPKTRWTWPPPSPSTSTTRVPRWKTRRAPAKTTHSAADFRSCCPIPLDFEPPPPHTQLSLVEAAMSPVKSTETTVKSQIQVLSGIGATEDQVDMRGTIGQRIDNKGTRVDDEAGTGEIDSSGG